MTKPSFLAILQLVNFSLHFFFEKKTNSEDDSQSSRILLRCTKLLKNRFGFNDTTGRVIEKLIFYVKGQNTRLFVSSYDFNALSSIRKILEGNVGV